MTGGAYETQVALLVRSLPEIVDEAAFALKGGTAINLFIRDLPRLSVDIDLVYLPVADRESSLRGVREGLGRIADRIRKRIGATVDENVNRDGTKLNVRTGATMIKIEASPVLRGTVFDPQLMPVSDSVQDRFGYAEMNLVSFDDLYAGKIAAALDRQHPRDIFDIRYLLANEGVSDRLFTTFLVYLISHNRPPQELLSPHLLDIERPYHGEFAGMTVEAISLGDLQAARSDLIAQVAQRARLQPASDFLRCFYALEPDWKLLDLTTDVSALPAVRWKMKNLDALRQRHPEKFAEQAARLSAFLDG